MVVAETGSGEHLCANEVLRAFAIQFLAPNNQTCLLPTSGWNRSRHRYASVPQQFAISRKARQRTLHPWPLTARFVSVVKQAAPRLCAFAGMLWDNA